MERPQGKTGAKECLLRPTIWSRQAGTAAILPDDAAHKTMTGWRPFARSKKGCITPFSTAIAICAPVESERAAAS
eukprot:scaffold32972_cov28-Tisochrysis_lutea.AAC.15